MNAVAIERPLAADRGSTDTSVQQYVTFLINGQLMGVPVKFVQEVLNPQEIAPTPLARPEISGLLNLRGQIVTAVSLRRVLRLPDAAEPNASMNVVVHFQSEAYSLLVDEVGDVVSLNEQDIEPPPRTIDSRWRSFTTGVVRLEGSLLLVMDVGQLLGLS